MQKYKHLTAEQRYHIYALCKAGKSHSEIADDLRVHKSTISREIARNKGQRGYRPGQAQTNAEDRKSEALSNRPSKFSDSDWVIIETLITQDYSPEQISGRLAIEGEISISHETIYQRIYADKAQKGSLYKHLRNQKKRKKRYGSGLHRRGAIVGRVGIEMRPEEVELKNRIGDWEGDTVIGAHHKGAIVTLAERKSRFLLAGYVERKDADSVSKKVIELLSAVGSKAKTITFDNGKEFANHAHMSKALGVDVYFARPYHSWERGLNENCNGLLRQYFPKGSSFKSIKQESLLDALTRMNHRPKKVLNWRTPYEVFFAEEISYTDQVRVALQT